MALPNVNIEIQNGGLGRVATTADGIAGLVVTNDTSTEIPLGTAFLLTSKRGVDALDAELTAHAKEQLLNFFAEAGDGSQLYVMPVADTVLLDDVVDTHLPALIAFAQGAIKIIGISLNPDNPTITDGTPANFVTDVKALQTYLESLQAVITPVRAVVGHYGFDEGDLADLAARAAFATRNVGVVISCNDEDAAALPHVGLLLGRLAKIAVSTNIGRVKDGVVATQTAYIGGVKAEDFDGLDTLYQKGYIFVRTFPGRSGYYWVDDPTMVVTTDDYATLANGRVIDKAIRLLYDTYLEQLNDSVQLDPATGKLPV